MLWAILRNGDLARAHPVFWKAWLRTDCQGRIASGIVERHNIRKLSGANLFEESGAEVHPDDSHNTAFPCHPEHAPFTEASCPRIDTIKTHLKVTCPECNATYWVRPRTFDHPLMCRVVFEWAASGPGGTRVYPVPSALLVRCDSPVWSDLMVIEIPEDPRPFMAHPNIGMFGPATTEGLVRRGYADVLRNLRVRAQGWSAWKTPSARLIAMAMPVTVNGHVAAGTGEILLATSWWQLPYGLAAVNAYCPRFGRGVVMHHSFAAVPRPVK